MNWKGIPITDGSGRQDRQPAALSPGYFNVDELAFEDLLTMAAGIASGLGYYNLANEIDGDWSDLFQADEAVIMAEILCTDLKRIESEFLPTASRNPALLAENILGLAENINRWYKHLSVCREKSAELLRRKLETVINETLIAQLHNLCKLIEYIEARTEPKRLARFDEIWKLPEAGNEPFADASIDLPRDPQDAMRQLSAIFHVFSNSISLLKSSAGYLIRQSLDSGQHAPAIGLFMAFLRLYARAQNRLNGFTARHLDFYYRQVLQVEDRLQIPDSYYLILASRAGGEAVRVKKDAGFSAGKDEVLGEIIYRADEDLVVSEARVESIATLYLQRDKLISPETELGLVTRIKSNLRRPLSGGAIAANRERPASWPLFGAEFPWGEKGITADARIGFSVASEILLLERGARKIGISIELEPSTRTGIDSEISNLLASDSAQAFNRRFSRLFARYLLTCRGCLSAAQKNAIGAKAQALLESTLARELGSLLDHDWQDLFYKLFKRIFRLKLTAEDGWMEVEDYILLPLSEEDGERKSGFRIELNLGQEVAPITAYDDAVHDAQLATDLPVLQCLINPQTNFYPYSIFQDLVISGLRIDVAVEGVNKLLAYNHNGQLDPSKPFQPFGPQPGGNSYLIVGNYELARKRLTGMRIRLEWAELPTATNGFEAHYQGYETAYGNSLFKASFSALANGRWMPADPEARTAFSLFDTAPEGNRIAPTKLVDIPQLDYARPVDAHLAVSDYRYDLSARNGFFRISLTGPDSAFGHGLYPQLLTRVLSANAKRKKQQPIPNPPYTPTLNGISLAYTASVTIRPGMPADQDDESADRIFHMHPFGVETLFPSAVEKPGPLMPVYDYEGNLFIGLSGRNVSGPMSLLFNLAQDRVPATISEVSSIVWFYLSANRWVKLSADQVLADSTHGFLSPGKISLDVPADITRGNSVMPAEYFWLRASIEWGAINFSSCYSLQTNAIKVSRELAQGSSPGGGEAATFPKPGNWSALRALDGIGAIEQAYPAFGGRARETEDEFKMRVSERLRHKNRALSPRDFEQLILEAFPEVMKVKCFNGISSTEDAIRPGHVLIVVVPQAAQDLAASCRGEMLGSQLLDRIRNHVNRLCSPFATIEVRNPRYERVQVRCSVKFADAVSDGVNIKRLNQHICDYICPWKPSGYTARFGWGIRQQDIESSILGLDYVEMVTNFSMLHITVDNQGRYSLFDTVKENRDRKAVIRPRYPWSLALPMEKHFIETMRVAGSIEAEITGIDELAVGSTFIIVGSSEDGEEE